METEGDFPLEAYVSNSSHLFFPPAHFTSCAAQSACVSLVNPYILMLDIICNRLSILIPSDYGG